MDPYAVQTLCPQEKQHDLCRNDVFQSPYYWPYLMHVTILPITMTQSAQMTQFITNTC